LLDDSVKGIKLSTSYITLSNTKMSFVGS
jgi:hypothetical protein